MIPILNSTEGLTIATGEVTHNLPALTLIQKANDGGNAKFAVLQIEAEDTTQDEQLSFIRGFVRGTEAFSIQASGSFIGRQVLCTNSVGTPFSILTNDALNINAQSIIRTDQGNKVGFWGAVPVSKPVLGEATANSTYSTNERDMLQKVYNALRTIGLAS